MRSAVRKLLGTSVVASGLILASCWTGPARGDEPGGRLGRLFRFGTNAPASSPARSTVPPAPGAIAAPPSVLPPATPSIPSDTGQRIRPVPRISHGVTESDPILTRVALSRASDGTPFCDFLQVFADGTVLDGSGVHRVSRDLLKPLFEAIQLGNAFRIHGHCGGPPADYIEQVHVVVYERSLGRLRANSFSYSGNPEGCDHTIKHIQTAIESIQAKISGPPVAAPASAGAAAPAPSAASTPAAPPSNPQVIPLTPIN